MLSVSLISQLLVEVEVANLIITEELKEYEESINRYLEEMKQPLDTEKTAYLLQSIDKEKIIIKKLHDCSDWIENLKNNYSNSLF